MYYSSLGGLTPLPEGSLSPRSLTGPLVSLLPLAEPSLGAMSDVTAAGVTGCGKHSPGIEHGILATQVSPLASPHSSDSWEITWSSRMSAQLCVVSPSEGDLAGALQEQHLLLQTSSVPDRHK